MNYKLLLPLAVGFLAACQNSNESLSSKQNSRFTDSAEAQLAIKSALASPNSQFVISGPQAGIENSPVLFSVLAPSGSDLSQTLISWSFGSGLPQVQGGEILQNFPNPGRYTVSATVKSGSNPEIQITQQILILPFLDQPDCNVEQLAIQGASELESQVAASYSVLVPSCLQSMISSVKWQLIENGGSSSQPLQVQSEITPTMVGPGQVQAQLFGVNSQVPFLTLVKDINILARSSQVQQLCPEPGTVRTRTLNLGSQSATCGTDGTKDVITEALISEECKYETPELLTWVEFSREIRVVSESNCRGQSCALPNGSGRISDGDSAQFYQQNLPLGSCSAIKETRTCQNGVLSGSYTVSTCNDGCGGFGSHGTVKTSVVIGEVQEPVSCPVASDNDVFNVFEQLANQTCSNGQILNSSATKGLIKSEGKCPVYQFLPTENYSECSAACGGNQSQIFECRNNSGKVFTDGRCGSNPPVVTRLCDGNPDSVKSEVSKVTTEEAPGSASCPKNQIGVIVNQREVTTTEKYACIDHAVKLAETVKTASPWVSESYCRDFTAYRCSHDSLNNTQAHGRFEWMKKCSSEVPVIAEFLEKFDNVNYKVIDHKTKTGKAVAEIDSNGRSIYPTFSERSNSGVKFWKAPVSAASSCAVPQGLFVAAACVSSCSTPEMMILSEIKNEKKMQYHSFVDALTQNHKRVATYDGKRASVEQWVTELEDTEHKILQFVMRSGGTLRVTPNHPLLSQEGIMLTADKFKVGDHLVQANGQLDPIVEINEQTHFGKVYNLFLKTNNPLRNIVTIQGYLNGSAYFQNEGAQDMNRKLLRFRIKEGALK